MSGYARPSLIILVTMIILNSLVRRDLPHNADRPRHLDHLDHPHHADCPDNSFSAHRPCQEKNPRASRSHASVYTLKPPLLSACSIYLKIPTAVRLCRFSVLYWMVHVSVVLWYDHFKRELGRRSCGVGKPGAVFALRP